MRTKNKGISLHRLLVCLVFFISLVSSYALADDYVSWEDYVYTFRETDKQFGPYDVWPIAEKEKLIQVLLDLGHILASANTDLLWNETTPETEKHNIADTLMLDLVGQHTVDGLQGIRYESVTYAIMGMEWDWTAEQRVWWQDVTYLYSDNNNPDQYVLAQPSDLPEADAIAIAKESIIDAYALPDDALDNAVAITNLYVTRNHPDYRRWEINLSLRDENDQKIGYGFSVTVSPDGRVIADPDLDRQHVREDAVYRQTLVDDQTPPMVALYQSYAEKEDSFLAWKWTASAKADYCTQTQAQIQEALKTNDLSVITNHAYLPELIQTPIQEMIVCSAFVYGYPNDTQLQAEEALIIAKQALMDEFAFDDEKLANLCHYESFDITHPDKPLWKFVFCPNDFMAEDVNVFYKVKIDANTHHLVTVFEIDFDQALKDENVYRLLY